MAGGGLEQPVRGEVAGARGGEVVGDAHSVIGEGKGYVVFVMER